MASDHTALAEPEEEEVPQFDCELGRHKAPIVATLTWAHGKPRTVCLHCLADAIQQRTGFKMVAVLQRMLTARAEAPMQREIAREARAYAEAKLAGLID